MLEKSFGLLFFLKQAKTEKRDVRYIYLRITVDGSSKELSTKRLWFQDRWNQTAGRATGTKEDAKILNAYLETLCSKVYLAKAALIEEDKQVTAESLKNAITGKDEDGMMLLKIFTEHNEQMKQLIGIDFAAATLDRYNTTYAHTRAFIDWKYGVEDVSLKQLNYDFVSEFAYWLKTVKKCGHNTAVKYITNLKKIVLQCIKRGWLRSDPFVGFKTTKKDIERSALTQLELDAIGKKRFSIDRLEIVRDIFLFSCYTGLAYIDVSGLKRDQIVTGIDNEKWIITHRQKTNTATRLPLLPIAQAMIEKYNIHPRCANDGYALPVLSNQKVNSYLKEIADLCSISKNLTFHIARHTFATTVTLSNGVPMETVSKMLGHKSLKQTQHYAKIVDLKISQDMAILKSKLR